MQSTHDRASPRRGSACGYDTPALSGLRRRPRRLSKLPRFGRLTPGYLGEASLGHALLVSGRLGSSLAIGDVLGPSMRQASREQSDVTVATECPNAPAGPDTESPSVVAPLTPTPAA